MGRHQRRFKILSFKFIPWLAILCGAALFFPIMQISAAEKAPAPNPSVRVARLAQIEGAVSIARSGATQWTKASDSDRLNTGDHLYVDRGGRVELQMGQTVVRAGSLTYLSITRLTSDAIQLALSQGTLHVRTFRLPLGNTVEVNTSNGTIKVTQPGDVRIDCYTNDGGTVVAVNSGEVQLRGPNLSKSLGTGQSVRLTGTNPITATALAMAGRDPFDVWSRQRDRQLLHSQMYLGTKEEQ